MVKSAVAVAIALLVTTSSLTPAKAQVDCSALDPRAKISSQSEGRVQAAATTMYKIAKAGGTVEGKLKREVDNLPQGASVSDQALIKLRTLYLFCGMVANATDIPTDRKVQLYQAMMNLKPSAKAAKGKTRKTAASKGHSKKSDETAASSSPNREASSKAPTSNAIGNIQTGNIGGSLTINQGNTYGISEETYRTLQKLTNGQEAVIETLVRMLAAKDAAIADKDAKILDYGKQYAELDERYRSLVAQKNLSSDDKHKYEEAKIKLDSGDFESARKVLAPKNLRVISVTQ